MNSKITGGGSDPASLVSQNGAAATQLTRWWHCCAMYARPSSALGTTLVLLFLAMALFGPLIAPYSATEQISGAARQAPSLAASLRHRPSGTGCVQPGRAGCARHPGAGRAGHAVRGADRHADWPVQRLRGGMTDEVTFRLFDSLLALPALLLALLLLGIVGPSRQQRPDRDGDRLRPHRGAGGAQRGAVHQAEGLRRGRACAGRKHVRPSSAARSFPRCCRLLAVEAALRFSYAIFLVASLGFLGVGVQPPSPDWGLMVNQARPYVSLTPWALWFPGQRPSPCWSSASIWQPTG